jgi:Ribbon-helix-helix protein, copG family
MPAAVHNATAKFRLNEDLLAKAESKARANGMSLAEMLRQAVRREVLEDA